MKRSSYFISIPNILWDLWCIVSVIGIWPRFVEPKLISTTHLPITIPHLPKGLHGFKILHFSDLHLGSHISNGFLDKLKNKIETLCPDMIVFTGDFICNSNVEDPKRLQQFFSSVKAPQGCYAILGNHDYEEYVSINAQGDYDVIDERHSPVGKGLQRLWKKPALTKKITARAKHVNFHPSLCKLLSATSFEVLHNATRLIPVKDSFLNICGLGEYMLGKCAPQEAFKTYDTRYPGIVLAHNPDSIPLLEKYPGDLVLCGHTHGGQVNLPILRKKFILLENMRLKKGLWKIYNKWVYINRGIGSVMKFRWFSLPEITLITLRSK